MKNKSLNLGYLRLALVCLLICNGQELLAQEAEHPGRQADQSAPAKLPACTKPKYPLAALRREAEGVVTLSFLIGPDGAVKESKVRRSSGNADLDEAARTALEKCKFAPEIVDGKPVEAWTSVQYVWKLDGPSPYGF